MSPALAERTVGASEHNAFSSSWPPSRQFRGRPLSSRGHRGGGWLGDLGSSWKAISSAPSVGWDGGMHSGRPCQVCAVGRAHVGGLCLCTNWRSQGRALGHFLLFTQEILFPRDPWVITVGRGAPGIQGVEAGCAQDTVSPSPQAKNDSIQNVNSAGRGSLL